MLFIIAIILCNVIKMCCALMFIISNHYGIKCLSDLLQIEPCDELFKVISVVMSHWYMLNQFIIAIIFCNAKKIKCAVFYYS